MENKPFVFGVATSGDNFYRPQERNSPFVVQLPARCEYGVDFSAPLGERHLWSVKCAVWLSPIR